MNRSKRPINNILRKKMSKAIRNAQTGLPAKKTHDYSDELTAKEMSKKYPKKPDLKKEALVASMRKEIKAKKAKSKAATSKRTTPGTVTSESSPANAHREGKRWIKTLTKQTLANRAIDAHRGKNK